MAKTNGTGQGGKSFQDRELAARVRTLSLQKIEQVLKGKQTEFQKALLLRLAGSVLQRLNEVTGEGGGLERLANDLRQAPHEYRPSLHVFADVSVDALARDLHAVEWGKEYGKLDLPSSSSAGLDETEHAIIERIASMTVQCQCPRFFRSAAWKQTNCSTCTRAARRRLRSARVVTRHALRRLLA